MNYVSYSIQRGATGTFRPGGHSDLWTVVEETWSERGQLMNVRGCGQFDTEEKARTEMFRLQKENDGKD